MKKIKKLNDLTGSEIESGVKSKTTLSKKKKIERKQSLKDLKQTQTIQIKEFKDKIKEEKLSLLNTKEQIKKQKMLIKGRSSANDKIFDYESITGEKAPTKLIEFYERTTNISEDVLDVKNLKVFYKKGKKLINIVRGVDITVKRGQIVGIIGESGAGKSVLTKSLLNVDPVARKVADRMMLDGIDIYGLKDMSFIRGTRIGYIPQDPTAALNPTRTIWKQMEDTLIEHRPDLPTREMRLTYAKALLSKFGIRNVDEMIFAYPHTFSGGMKQRIIIAMTVSCRPSLIIADEPTTALDPTVQAAVLQLLDEVRTIFGISIIFISHNISVVAKFVDYMYVMYAGKVVEKGTKTDIFTDPKHPYTWALISSIPEVGKGEVLYTIKGTPPSLERLPVGDPFAPRNQFALKVDFQAEPPLFKISDSHYAATWLLDPRSEKVEMPEEVKTRTKLFKKVFSSEKGGK